VCSLIILKVGFNRIIRIDQVIIGAGRCGLIIYDKGSNNPRLMIYDPKLKYLTA
jgi:hypothetical protein